MLVRTIHAVFDEFNVIEAVAMLAFFSSVPIMLPCLDVLDGALALSMAGSFPPFAVEDGTYVWTMFVASMLTALALLFVCLLKTSHSTLGRLLARVGAVSYVTGYAVLVLAALGFEGPAMLLPLAGLPLGFGAAAVFLAWFSRLSLADFRSSFVAASLALLCSASAGALAALLPTGAGVCVLLALACAGSAGAFVGKRSALRPRDAVGGSNWWDVFGSLDVSLIEGADDFEPPASRVLFFLVAPLVMLLLFVANRSVPVMLDGPLTVTAAGCLIAVPCSLLLLLIKSEQALVNASYRLFLPLTAFCVFAASSFVSGGAADMVMSVGINVFCALYFLLLAGMFLTMAGRMRSLVLPAGSMLIMALSLIALLSSMEVDAGSLIVYQRHALIALFVIAVATMLATPGSRMWRMVLEGVAREEGSPAPFIADRCAALADEHGLTEREAEVLAYLGRGYSATYVAEALVIAESTARSHRKNIYRKLGVSSREELFELLDGDAVGDESTTGRSV